MDKLADHGPAAPRRMVMQQMQLQPGDPRLQQVIGVENDITDLDVDITVAEGNEERAQPAGRGIPEPRAAGLGAAWAYSLVTS